MSNGGVVRAGLRRFDRFLPILVLLTFATTAALAAPTDYTFVDLNNSATISSQGLASGGGRQAGQAFASDLTTAHAAVWSGDSADFVDLNPSGFDKSRADGTSPDQQVGSGLPSGGGVLYADSVTLKSALDARRSYR